MPNYRFDEKFKDDPEILKDKKKYLHLMEMLELAGDAAERWQDVSARGVEEFHEYTGDLVINWKERGYSTILDILIVNFKLFL